MIFVAIQGELALLVTTIKDIQRNILVLAERFNIAVSNFSAKKSDRFKWEFVTVELATSGNQCISEFKM